MKIWKRGSGARARLVRGATAAALACATVVALSSSATANLSPNAFDGSDGDLGVTDPAVTNPALATDWTPLYNADHHAVTVGTDIASGASDNAFANGAKEDDTSLSISTGSIPPNKNDLTRFYEASQFAGGHVYLDLAWERLVNIGSANMDFEINKVDNSGSQWLGDAKKTTTVGITRSDGDVLLSYQFSGSGTPSIVMSTWRKTTLLSGQTCVAATAPPCWAGQTTLPPSQAEAKVNTVSIDDPIAGITGLGVGLFGETSIDLTAAGVFPANSCENFGDVFVKSRSSGSSFTSELKDFIAPQSVHINNCSSITVAKVTDNDPTPLAGSTKQTFTFHPSGNLSGSDFSLSGGGSTTFNQLGAGNYSVGETGPGTNVSPAGTWTLDHWSCNDSPTNNSTTSPGATASVPLTLGEDVTCTFYNHFTNQPTLTTTPSSTSITVGDSVHDSASLTLTSAHTPTGTVEYKTWSSSDCKTTPFNLGGTYTGNSFGIQNLVAGSIPDSPSYQFKTVPPGGKVYFSASYVSGDTYNKNADDVAACDEVVTVNPATPSAATTQTLLPNDTFTLSGFATSTPLDTSKKVTFNLYKTSCTTTPVYTEQVAIGADGTASTTNGSDPLKTYKATGNATWYWTASWPGDANNSAASSGCTKETFNITQ